jgi:hypothetical protein
MCCLPAAAYARHYHLASDQIAEQHGSVLPVAGKHHDSASIWRKAQVLLDYLRGEARLEPVTATSVRAVVPEQFGLDCQSCGYNVAHNLDCVLTQLATDGSVRFLLYGKLGLLSRPATVAATCMQ